MRAVVYTGAGGNEVVRLDDRRDPVPGPEDLVVEVRYAGLNPADLQQRDGNYPAPPGAVADVPGLEVSGVVAAVGKRVTTWKEGDRVFGLVGGGGLAEQALVHERLLARVPDNIEDRTAAAIPEAFITAHDAVVTQAGLLPGETLVVQGANGGVGTAALQIALGRGARAIGVVRSDSGRRTVAALGAEPASAEELPGLLADTRGADVVLELLGAATFASSFAALSRQGRIVVVGTGTGTEVSINLQTLMGKRAALRGTVLRGRALEEKAAAVRAFEREVVPGLALGTMRGLVDRVFPVDRATDAFDYMLQPGKAGKVLLQFAGA
jgi:NADPH2:quinone reductase